MRAGGRVHGQARQHGGHLEAPLGFNAAEVGAGGRHVLVPEPSLRRHELEAGGLEDGSAAARPGASQAVMGASLRAFYALSVPLYVMCARLDSGSV